MSRRHNQRHYPERFAPRGNDASNPEPVLPVTTTVARNVEEASDLVVDSVTSDAGDLGDAASTPDPED